MRYSYKNCYGDSIPIELQTYIHIYEITDMIKIIPLKKSLRKIILN